MHRCERELELKRVTSHAPPPATMLWFLIALLTIMIASCRLLSTSAMNCSAPPLNTSVQVLAAGQSSKKLNRSPPICRSSKRPQVPRCWSWMSEHVDEMLPPVAWTTRSRSPEETRPAQKMSRSAKYLLRCELWTFRFRFLGGHSLCSQIANGEFT